MFHRGLEPEQGVGSGSVWCANSLLLSSHAMQEQELLWKDENCVCGGGQLSMASAYVNNFMDASVSTYWNPHEAYWIALE